MVGYIKFSYQRKLVSLGACCEFAVPQLPLQRDPRFDHDLIGNHQICRIGISAHPLGRNQPFPYMMKKIITILLSTAIYGCSTAELSTETWIPSNVRWSNSLLEADSTSNYTITKMLRDSVTIAQEISNHPYHYNYYWSVDTLLVFENGGAVAIDPYLFKMSKADSFVTLSPVLLSSSIRRIGKWVETKDSVLIFTNLAHVVDLHWDTIPGTSQTHYSIFKRQSRLLAKIYFNNRLYRPFLDSWIAP